MLKKLNREIIHIVRQVKNHLTWARRFSMAELVAALEGAVDVELALKGSADSQTALLLWITNILRKS